MSSEGAGDSSRPVVNSSGPLQRALTDLTQDLRPPTDAEREIGTRIARDTASVALAAHTEGSVAVARAAASGDTGQTRVWGTDLALTRQAAALVNGTAVQALEFDDIDPYNVAHQSSVVLPALAACASAAPADDAFAGIIAALRAGDMIGPLMGRAAHHRGVQPTHTIGTLAASVAIARALRMPAEAASSFMGLAVCGIIGIRAHSGTPAKSMLSGLAASAVVRAFELAQAGASSGAAAADFVVNLLGEDTAYVPGPVSSPQGPAVKLYPSCGAAHTAVEATLRLREQLGSVTPERLEVRVPARVITSMPYLRPTAPYEARWSVLFAVHQAWRWRTLGLEHFTQSAVDEYASVAGPDWLSMVPEESFDPLGEQATATAWVDGEPHEVHIEQRLGYPGRPLSEKHLREKFDACMQLAPDPAWAADLWEDLAVHPLQPLSRGLGDPR